MPPKKNCLTNYTVVIIQYLVVSIGSLEINQSLKTLSWKKGGGGNLAYVAGSRRLQAVARDAQTFGEQVYIRISC